VRRPKIRCSFLAGVVGALLVLAAWAVIAPQYSNYETRVHASEVLSSIRPIQDRVSSQALARQSVSGSGQGISYEPVPAVRDGWVLADGEIVVRGSHFGQVFVLVPSYSDGAVSWRCIGGSAKDVPRRCRD
jgi:hypothetical protein